MLFLIFSLPVFLEGGAMVMPYMDQGSEQPDIEPAEENTEADFDEEPADQNLPGYPQALADPLAIHVSLAPGFFWEDYPVIAHALGGIGGFPYLNCREGFLQAYENGCRLFEVDLTRASDGVWVCRHSWTDPLGQWDDPEVKRITGEEFKNARLQGRYTPMTFEDFLLLLKDYPDAYALIDSKHYSIRNYQSTLRDYAEYVAIAQEAGAGEVLDRLIPEIYNDAMFPGTAMLYPFPALIYSIWESKSEQELSRIAGFCEEHGIEAVTISLEEWNSSVQDIFTEKGISVFVYTVNDPEQARQILKAGAAGICTDWLFS